MFGEYGIYFDGKIVAVAADNSLFLKPTEAGRALLPNVVEAPPYPEAKNWFQIDEYLDDTELLQRLIRVTADALPVPKPKAAKKPRKAGGAKKT
jgi:TfoX/Sxy family transcriptional regulator of competence genes